MEWKATESETVMQALQRQFPASSKNTIKSWIEKGRISINKKIVRRGNVAVWHNQTITFGSTVKFADDNVKVLYQDDSIIVIEKPAGLLSVATSSQSAHTAYASVKNLLQKPIFPVHRLDRETSGIMMFALTGQARNRLKILFAQHDIKREYIALVEGKLQPISGFWSSCLLESRALKVYSAKEGKHAVTHYHVEKYHGNISKVCFRLETGRKNQIRVHASEAGHPIVGDFKYGAKNSSKKRLCLHARLLGFCHPLTGKEMVFTSVAPF